MTIIDDRTPHLNLALPNKDNTLEDDVQRLRSALGDIDTAVSGKADLVAGKVPAGQLPSFVDDVVESANFASLPATGETGKIYVTLDTNRSYRWSGSAYVEISPSPGTTDDVIEGSTNKYFTASRALAAIPNADAATFGLVKVGAGLGIDGNGALFSSSGAGSVMTLQEIVPGSNGLSSVTVPGGYVAGAILVAVNGAWLAPSDYTATNGTSIAFIGLTVGTADTVLVAKLATVTLANLPAGSVGATQLADGAVLLQKLDSAALNRMKQIQPVDASVAGNALTLTLNPTSLDFRSATLGSGAINTRAVSAAVSLVVPSGATLGTVNGQKARLVLIAIDNAGTVELAIANIAGGVNLDETTLISTTAISSSANSASAIYSTAARSNVPFRVVGFIDITEATAGTWATEPTTIQGQGGQALSAMQSIGYGQTPQNVTASRAVNTTYYNTTGRPIEVAVTLNGTAFPFNASLTIGGVTKFGSCAVSSGVNSTVSGIVPPGASYSVSATAGTPSLVANGWIETR